VTCACMVHSVVVCAAPRGKQNHVPLLCAREVA
jgi:hypothetical protein